ncbi:MAG TPA: glycoside hydrolase family 43 protein [Sphingomicrobium sp.]|jgi:beta-xylosidase
MTSRVLARAFAAAASLFLVAAAPAADPSFVPVLETNFPDAFVLQRGGDFIAYATNDGANVPVATSRDLKNWALVADRTDPKKKHDAMPKLGSWAKEGFTWAPEVLELNGKYLLYYTASDRKRDAQCIGVAVASDPLGPFVDSNADPIVCQTKLGGTIDANPFRDADGKLYLYFKNDGNRVRARTSLWGQALTPDGLRLVGEPVELLKDNEKWQERVIEAPTMVRGPGGYSMFYSGGFFGWNPDEGGLSPYALGYASCSGPLGPCTPFRENPILHSFKDRGAGCLSGPGHQSIFTVGNRTFMSFHAWAATASCRKGEDARYLYVAPLFWKDGKWVIGPSMRPTAARRGERG